MQVCKGLCVMLLIQNIAWGFNQAPLPVQITPQVDAILTALERRGVGLRDIRCRVRFTEEDRVNITKTVKEGTIRLLVTKTNPHFLIHFERCELDGGMLGKQEWYLFDGYWLYQAVERLRQVTKQQVDESGQSIDLFDLETAPFPLPFGQKKEKILSNFDVTLVPVAKGDPPNTDHLVCVPKPDSRVAKKYEKLDFFVDRDVHLPRRVIMTKNKGYEINTADFPDLSNRSINSGVTKKDLGYPTAWKNYTIVEE